MQSTTQKSSDTEGGTSMQTLTTKDCSVRAADCAGYQYAIRVRGHLDARKSACLKGMTVTVIGGGRAVIEGPVADQTALCGLFHRLGQLDLWLVGAKRLGSAGEAAKEIS